MNDMIEYTKTRKSKNESSKFQLKIKQLKSIKQILSILFMSRNIQQQLTSYIKQNTRIKYKLSFTIDILRQCKKPLQQIKKSIKNLHEPLKIFKILILLHQCLFDSILQPLSIVQLITTLKKQTQPKTQIQLDLLIYNKIINPYALYLQKCYNAKSQSNYKTQQSIQNLYLLINILNQGLAMVDVLYTFGRYYQSKYQFIADFNVILARDFQQIYQCIKKIFNNNLSLTDQAKDGIIVSLEGIHQKMYVVYFNYYYYAQIRNYVPSWIDTQSNVSRNEQQFLLTLRKQQKNVNKSSSRLINNKNNLSLSLQTNSSNHSCKGQLQWFYSQQKVADISCETKVSQAQKNNGNKQLIEEIQYNRMNLLQNFKRVVGLFDSKITQSNKS